MVRGFRRAAGNGTPAACAPRAAARPASSTSEFGFKDHACVVLTKNLPDEGLEAGDVGTVAHIHKDGVAYEVEFVTLTGETVAVVTVEASHVRPLSRCDRAHTRELQTA